MSSVLLMPPWPVRREDQKYPRLESAVADIGFRRPAYPIPIRRSKGIGTSARAACRAGRRAIVRTRLSSLQRVEHREHGQDRIFSGPRLRRGAEDEVFERRRAERLQSGIDAGRIGVEHALDTTVRRAPARDARRRGSDARACPRSTSIARGPTRPDNSPAGWRRCRSIWKKRSCACRKPSARGDVFAGRAGDGRHAERVAIDADIRGEAGDRRGAVDLRQAGAHLRAGIETAGRRSSTASDDQHDQEESAGDAETSRRILRAGNREPGAASRTTLIAIRGSRSMSGWLTLNA